MLQLNMIETLAFGGVVLYLGYVIRRVIPFLARYNLPAPVLGGLLISVLVLVARQWDWTPFQFNMALREPLMIAFFTTIGFGASFGLLKKGGTPVLIFFALSTVAAVLQNVVGAAAAVLMGQPALFGVLCGSVTLTGGPGTGLAFAPAFEEAGVVGAGPIAAAAAMGGIVAGGLIGAPLGTLLIERLHRQRAAGTATESPMIVAAVIHNLDDFTGWIGLSQEVLDELGNVALSFFLVLALMTLELWKLAAVALPLLVILALQTALVAGYCLWPIFRWMGRDYEAAVMTGGFCGFMMGTTANATANMDALVRRYGPAPRAFLVVPMVGAFFIDFVNMLLIQGCLNLASWFRV